jgi:hypothetical protein
VIITANLGSIRAAKSRPIRPAAEKSVYGASLTTEKKVREWVSKSIPDRWNTQHNALA